MKKPIATPEMIFLRFVIVPSKEHCCFDGEKVANELEVECAILHITDRQIILLQK